MAEDVETDLAKSQDFVKEYYEKKLSHLDINTDRSTQNEWIKLLKNIL